MRKVKERVDQAWVLMRVSVVLLSPQGGSVDVVERRDGASPRDIGLSDLADCVATKVVSNRKFTKSLMETVHLAYSVEAKSYKGPSVSHAVDQCGEKRSHSRSIMVVTIPKKAS